jgi:CheY-like chemotaxis protein
VDPNQRSPPARPLSVLVVEDHPDAARALAILLPLLCGCRVRVALSVAEALDAAAVGPFDAVLSDIGLPDGDGCDLAGRLLRLLPARPLLVAITALGVLAEDRCRAAGFDHFFIKPADPDDLARLLANHAERRAG